MSSILDQTARESWALPYIIPNISNNMGGRRTKRNGDEWSSGRPKEQPDYAQSSARSRGFPGSRGLLGARASRPRAAEGPPWSNDARDPRNAVVPR